MLKSMTGYGKSTFESKGRTITTEVKSLNSKQCDTALKINPMFRELEQDIRNLIARRLQRGKIDMYIGVEYPDNYSPFNINSALFYKYHDELTVLANDTKEKTREFLPVIMGMPDIMKQTRQEADTTENEKLISAVNQAIDMLDAFRSTEGQVLETELNAHTARIESLLRQTDNFEALRIEKVRTKLSNALQQSSAADMADKNRFEQEIIYYLEKMDFSEEKTRLRQHCAYFTETLRESESNGRKLSFIAQEMGREINTLGSKANDFEIQKLVVEMKDTLEKIKEQLANIL